ncbi:MAG: hypothetical protein ACXVCH_17840, partial [Bdellovibrionota bacterium]
SEIRLVRERPHFTADSLWFTEDAATREKSLVRESGTLRYDPKAKRFIFEPEYGIDLSHSETDEILARAEKDHGIRASRVANPDLAESRVLNCMDVLLNQASGSSLAIDKLVGDFAVTSIVVTTDQLAGGARLSTKEGRRVFLADLLGGAVTNLIGSSVGKSLVVSNSGLAASLATRAGVGFGLTQVQNKITEAFVGGQSETPKNIARFNDVHFAARVPINHFVDTELIQKVPWMGFDACRKGSLAKIFISPRAIRIYERGISAIIYYSARKATIHQ